MELCYYSSPEYFWVFFEARREDETPRLGVPSLATIPLNATNSFNYKYIYILLDIEAGIKLKIICEIILDH